MVEERGRILREPGHESNTSSYMSGDVVVRGQQGEAKNEDEVGRGKRGRWRIHWTAFNGRLYARRKKYGFVPDWDILLHSCLPRLPSLTPFSPLFWLPVSICSMVVGSDTWFYCWLAVHVRSSLSSVLTFHADNWQSWHLSLKWRPASTLMLTLSRRRRSYHPALDGSRRGLKSLLVLEPVQCWHPSEELIKFVLLSWC